MKKKINSLILCETKDCCSMRNMIKRSFRQSVAEQLLEDTIAKQHTRVSLVTQMVKRNTHIHKWWISTWSRFIGNHTLAVDVHGKAGVDGR